MTLAAEQGSTPKPKFHGEDENELSGEMVKFFEDGFENRDNVRQHTIFKTEIFFFLFIQ